MGVKEILILICCGVMGLSGFLYEVYRQNRK